MKSPSYWKFFTGFSPFPSRKCPFCPVLMGNGAGKTPFSPGTTRNSPGTAGNSLGKAQKSPGKVGRSRGRLKIPRGKWRRPLGISGIPPGKPELPRGKWGIPTAKMGPGTKKAARSPGRLSCENGAMNYCQVPENEPLMVMVFAGLSCSTQVYSNVPYMSLVTELRVTFTTPVVFSP